MLPAGLVLFLLLSLFLTPQPQPMASGSWGDACLAAIRQIESAEPAQFAAGGPMASSAMGLATVMPFEAHWATDLASLPGVQTAICPAEPVATEPSPMLYLVVLFTFFGLGVNVNGKRKWDGSEYAEADQGPMDCGLPLGC